MQEARARAPGVQAARARLDAARARARQAAGFRLPSLDLQETFIRTNSPADAFALKLNQERFSFADFTTSDPNHPASLDTAITRLELTMPLYTGGELSGRIAQADQASQAAARDLAWAGDQAALAAAEAYVSLSQAEEYRALLTRSRETVAAHVRLAKAYVDQGMLVESELLRAKVELARLDDLVLEAVGRVRVAAANLAFRLGADESTTWDLDPVPAPARPSGSLEEWLASARSRSDIVAARAKLRAGELEERVRKAAFLPKLGVVARRDLVDDTLFGSHGNSTALMAVANVNLFAGGSDRAAVTAARWEVAAGRADLGRFERGVALEVRQAWEEAETALARHATAGQAVAAAREGERITKERFAAGVVKMLDLLDASTARREAETRELVTRAGAVAAVLRLAVDAGRPPESALP
jgi:outer membrane protein